MTPLLPRITGSESWQASAEVVGGIQPGKCASRFINFPQPMCKRKNDRKDPLRKSRIFMAVVLLAGTMLVGVAHAQESERDETTLRLPLTSLNVSTTVDLSRAADQEPQQPKSPKTGKLPPVEAPKAKRLGCTVDFASLTDAPRPQAIAPRENSDSPQSSTASLSGTVIDKNGAVMEGVPVTLTGPPGSPVRTVQSGSNGQFEFTGLTPDTYKLTVNAPGMNTFTSPPIPLDAGEFRILPPIILSVSPVTTTVVPQQAEPPGADKSPDIDAPKPKTDALAPVNRNPNDTIGKQPKRILWIIPNYRAVSANTYLPPQSVKEKFWLATQETFDYSNFILVGMLSGQSLGANSQPSFGDGWSGYGKYYWHSFADGALENYMVEAVAPSLTKQDPRYYTLGKGGFFKRTGYAISRLVITRTDAGHNTFNFSEIGGAGAAAATSNSYYPAVSNPWVKTYQRWGTQMALDAVFNVAKEFWPDINQRVFHEKY